MARIYGTRYDQAHTVTEIPALIRADIKEAQRAGRLPSHMKCSVRRTRATYMWSIDVRITQWGARQDITVDPTTNRTILAPELAEALELLQEIVSAYNHDGSDVLSDYCDVRFFSSVDLDYTFEKAARHRFQEAQCRTT